MKLRGVAKGAVQVRVILGFGIDRMDLVPKLFQFKIRGIKLLFKFRSHCRRHTSNARRILPKFVMPWAFS